MKNNIVIHVCFLVTVSCTVFAQDSPFPEPELLDSINVIEQLVEQSGDLEDSPVVELLSDQKEKTTNHIELRSRIMQRLQQSVGYTDGTYLGSSFKSYHRLKWSGGERFSGGILMEKDAGERKVHDFISGNLMMRETGFISKLIFGDFLVESGQGVALWRGLDAAKGADIVTPVMRRPRGVVPYLSSDENAFFRGGALQLDIQKLTIDLFYSIRNRDATVEESGNVSGFYTTGYFRTENEKAKKAAVTERLLGAVTRYNVSEHQSVGFTFYQTAFSRPLNFDDEEFFSRSRFSVASVDYTLYMEPARLFGEWARSEGEIGGISGILLRPFPEITFITAFRKYPPGFISLHGLGFGERTGAGNEQGMYVGIHLKPISHVTLIGYSDQFSFPVPDGSSRFPSHGSERFLQANIRAVRRLSLSLRYAQKRNERGNDIRNAQGFMTRISIPEFRTAVRIHGEYTFNTTMRLRIRYERVHVASQGSERHETGTVLFQDLVVKPYDGVWCDVRLVFFQTDSYNARIYAYENDLEGTLSLPVLYGTGFRWYLMVKYEVSAFLRVSLKYSDIIRDDIKRIGTGAERLPSNHDNRIGVQLDVKL